MEWVPPSGSNAVPGTTAKIFQAGFAASLDLVSVISASPPEERSAASAMKCRSFLCFQNFKAFILRWHVGPRAVQAFLSAVNMGDDLASQMLAISLAEGIDNFVVFALN